MNDMNECEPIYVPITCSVKHCASCDDDSTCNKCNSPYQLIDNNECQLCEEGTYFNENDESCEGISFLMKMFNC